MLAIARRAVAVEAAADTVVVVIAMAVDVAEAARRQC